MRMLSRLFARKSFSSMSGDLRRSELRKDLTLWQLTALGVGAIVGAGIFVQTGLVARETTGPSLVLSFLVAAITCGFAALCYAELASMVPVVGSAYIYAYAMLGEIPAWTVGWTLVLGYGVSASAVAHGSSSYFQDLIGIFGVRLPESLTDAAFRIDQSTGSLTPTGKLLDLPAIVITVAITLVLIKGVSTAANFNTLMVLVKIVIILFVIGAGVFYVLPANWTPFAPYGLGGVTLFGKTLVGRQGNGGEPIGMLAGAGMIFFAYVGFDAVSMYTEEARRPERDVPLGIISALTICSVLYIGVSAVLTGMVPFNKLDAGAPISNAFKQVGLPWAQMLISLGALTATVSVVLVTMLTQSRLLLALSRDELIPPRLFGRIHKRFQTPWTSTLFAGGFVALTNTLLQISSLFGLVSIGILMVYLIVCLAVFILRFKEPDAKRPFKVRSGRAVSVLGILSCFLLMVSLPRENWVHLTIWLVLGLLVYLVYGFSHAAKRAGGQETT